MIVRNTIQEVKEVTKADKEPLPSHAAEVASPGRGRRTAARGIAYRIPATRRCCGVDIEAPDGFPLVTVLVASAGDVPNSSD